MNNDLPKQVSIIGAGYVGMSLAALIAEFVDIKIWDTDKRKRELINSKKNYDKNNRYTKFNPG